MQNFNNNTFCWSYLHISIAFLLWSTQKICKGGIMNRININMFDLFCSALHCVLGLMKISIKLIDNVKEDFFNSIVKIALQV